MDPGEAIPLASAFSSLDKLIDAFKAILPPVEQLDMTMPSIVRSTFVTHTLTSAATIQLHTFLSETDDSSHQKYVAAAEFIFALIPKVDLLSFGQVNPFLGPIWTRACQVIIREIARLRSLHSGWSPTISQNRERELADMLERAFGAMALFSMESHLMSRFPRISSVVVLPDKMQVTSLRRSRNNIRLYKGCDISTSGSNTARVQWLVLRLYQ